MDKVGYDSCFGRNIGVINNREQQRLRGCKVAIAGAGGVGGNVFAQLIRAGVTQFVIADFDTFSTSNMNRQHGAVKGTIGQMKVDVLKDYALSFHDEIQVETYPEGITEENIDAFLEGVDVLVDAIDFMAPVIRKKMLDRAKAKGIFAFLAPAMGFGASLIIFDPAGISHDDFFGEMPEKMTPEYVINIGNKLFPNIPDYVDMDAYMEGAAGKKYLPTFSTAVMLASTMVATNVVLALVDGSVEFSAPQVLWLDLKVNKMELISL